jgi:hypothetical protein
MLPRTRLPIRFISTVMCAYPAAETSRVVRYDRRSVDQSGAYDNTSRTYTLQQDRVYLSVTMICNVFTYPFSMLILGAKVP